MFIWVAGTRLVRYLDAIAVKTGLGQAFVGMLLLGSITSLPEIANVMTSSSMGNPSLAINNLLGSASITFFCSRLPIPLSAAMRLLRLSRSRPH